MGQFLCEKHGLSGNVVPCQHVATELDNGRFGKFYEVGMFLVCETCLHKHELERFVGQDVWGGDEELFDAFIDASEKLDGNDSRCSECIAVVQVEQARSDGKDDPFPVYERTLNSHSADVINDLDSLLKKKFQFQKSIVDGRDVAMFVMPGTYTRPLTIRIYYVTSEDEQTQLVALVKEFFESFRENQVKVEFFEAEVWEIWSDPETEMSGGERDEEKLLKEVFLNCE